jgi:ribonuclease G
MSKELIVSAASLERKLAILEDDQVTELFLERQQSRSNLGNVYKGRVTRVLPGMQAAFVDIGLERNAFLYVSDFFEDYEDYEELLGESSLAADRYLQDQSESDSRKPSKRTRRSLSKRSPPKKRAEKKRDDKREREVTDSLLRSISEHDAPAVQILPDYLTLESSLRLAAEEWEEDPPSAEDGSILPDRLPVENRQKRRKTSRRSPGKRAARLEGPSDRSEFAVGRSSATKRKTSSRGESKNSEPLIANLLKEGQEILVQVAKEPIGKKGARITSHIVFPGRYLVFMPTVNHVGVSRRIESQKERQRLRDTVQDLRGEIEKGFIVRTAGEGQSKADFRQDMLYLTKLWEDIRARAEKLSAPALVHSELGLVQRVIRDFFSDDYRAIRVDDENEYERIVEFINDFNPVLATKVRLYSKSTPIFDEFHINAEIERALKSKVWLRTGGYIVVNQTEALVAIDVNTGKYVGRTNSLEDTIAKTNLDAVREVARQIRLRDLGGIIVIDFIDMTDPVNQQKVLEALQRELKKDKAPSKILPFNEFGLVAITRKRVKQSLERSLCQPCTYCDGTGMVKSVRSVCYAIHQEVRRLLATLGDGRELVVRCHPDVGRALRDSESAVVRGIEEITGKELTVRTDPLMHIERFDLIEA